VQIIARIRHKSTASPVSQFTINGANDNWQIPFDFWHRVTGVAADIQFRKFQVLQIKFCKS
jgi:hypothetical protein